MKNENNSHLDELLDHIEDQEAVIESTGVWQAVAVIKAIPFWTDGADGFVETPLYRAVKDLIVSAAERGADVGYILAALRMDIEQSPGYYQDLRESLGPDPVKANQFGGPQQITVHVFEDAGSGPGQHLGSITFPDWVAFGSDPEDQPTAREMAAKAWNFMLERSKDAVLGVSMAIVGRDGPMPTRGCLGCCSEECLVCFNARRGFPDLWAAILEIRDT
jgi:hypothetical protein